MQVSNHKFLQTRLAFLNVKSLVRLCANPAVIPQKISNNFSLHQVFLVIDSKWRTNFICTKSQITIRQEKDNTMARKMKGFRFLRKYCTNVTAGQFSMPSIRISGTDKTEISHVRLFMIISHVKIIAFQTITSHSFWTFYIGGKLVVYNNKQENTWVLGNTRFISRVEYDISHS